MLATCFHSIRKKGIEMVRSSVRKSYATFDLLRSYRQILFALQGRNQIENRTRELVGWIKDQERLIESALCGPVENLRILEIGPGQGMHRARYFGIKNEVVGIDLDVIQRGFNLNDYLLMLKQNGPGRLLKTIGWQIILGPTNERVWKKVLQQKKLPYPLVHYADICSFVPEEQGFDMVLSWSVFEHLPDPKAALINSIKALRTGGILFISLHLYTSINGHHDIRAFTGEEDNLPPWGHLRAQTAQQFKPSAYLNKWRLSQWRDLLNEVAPGFTEILETGDVPEKFGPKLNNMLRQELKAYTQEELLSVNAVYMWKKTP
jgi:SAM-dependent methyltransferase